MKYRLLCLMCLLLVLCNVFVSCAKQNEAQQTTKQTIYQSDTDEYTTNKYSTKQAETDITKTSEKIYYTSAKNSNATTKLTSAQPMTIADSKELDSYFDTYDKEMEWRKGGKKKRERSFEGVYDRIYKWGDFKVGETSEGISIMQYKGTSKDVVIPEQINGKPVIALEGNEMWDSRAEEEYYESPFLRRTTYWRDIYVKIKTLSLPSTLKTIGYSALIIFGLERYIVSKDNLYYTSHDGVLYTKDMKVLLSIPIEYKEKKHKIPEGVEKIHTFAIKEKCVKEMIIPASLEKIAAYYTFTAVRVSEDNKYFSSINGSLYNKEKTKLLRYNPYSKDTVFTFPKTVTTIDDDTVLGKKIKEIRITENISKICFVDPVYKGLAANWITEELKSIVVDENNKYFSSADGVLFNKDKSELLLYPYSRPNKTYKIPKTVKSFRAVAFDGTKKLKELIIGKNVKRINGFVWATYSYNEFVIKGYKGTAAEKFAKRSDLKFIALDEEKTTETKTNPTTTTVRG